MNTNNKKAWIIHHYFLFWMMMTINKVMVIASMIVRGIMSASL